MKPLVGLVYGAIALTAVSAAALAAGHQKNEKLMNEIKSTVSDAGDVEAIYERRMTMRELSGNAKIIAAFMKEGKGSAADVSDAARKISEIAKTVPDLFPAGATNEKYSDATGAKAIIWEKNAEFEDAAMNLASLADKLADVASASGADKAAIGAAFGAMGKDGCGGCHRTFRQKLN